MSISKLLIANRGEIGCRIIKTCQRLGIKVVSVYSDADREASHVKIANEAYYIGQSQPHRSYLKIEKLINVAKTAKADAIHPGYGFLSESFEFANACSESGINFVGPPSSAIKSMGLKNLSKEIMDKAKVPIIPGYHGKDQDVHSLKREADKIGFPVMIKAVRGGGGKGMRISETAEDFFEMLDAAKRESKKAFNDDEMILEKYIVNPRHVEVQVFGDKHGNYVYLWERDCSIQRRHQKVLEEAPAPNIKVETRRAIGEAAVNAARAVGYVGAGTVEFVLDREENFFFMEMNTRLQVEHPVTESITNVDLVEWQLRVAQGEELPIKDQNRIPFLGHAFEARIYAEDCRNPEVMLPSAGKIKYLSIPPGSGLFEMGKDKVRVDKAIEQDQEISVFYDPMIAKLITWGEDRESALRKMRLSLDHFKVMGIPSNIEFLKKICDQEDVKTGILDTGYIANNIEKLRPTVRSFDENQFDAMASVLIHRLESFENSLKDPFYSTGFNQNRVITFSRGDATRKCRLEQNSFDNIRVSCDDGSEIDYRVELMERLKDNEKSFKCRIENKSLGNIKEIMIHRIDDGTLSIYDTSDDLEIQIDLPRSSLDECHVGDANASVDPKLGVSPMPGIIEKILVKKGDSVKKNQALVTLIAMKMEYTVRAAMDGKITNLLVEEGQSVAKGQKLTEIEES